MHLEKVDVINTRVQRAIAATTKVGHKLDTPREWLDDLLAIIGRFGEHAHMIRSLLDSS